MFYAVGAWKTSDRVWAEYPSEVMLPMTTLEETKPA